MLLDWEAAYATEYRVETSREGVNWQQVIARSNGSGGEDAARFEPVKARYVRVAGTKRATSYGCSLHELEVYRQ